MRLIIDIPEEVVTAIRNGEDYRYDIHTAIAQGRPFFDNITDEQISDAFMIAIANYWEQKSKYLTPIPTPCDCPIKKEVKE